MWKIILSSHMTFLAVVVAGANASVWPPKDDPSARTWLPASQETTLPAMDEFLTPLHGRLHILGCWYEGNQLRASRPFSDGKLAAGDCAWTCDTRFSPATNDLTITLKTISGETKSAGIAVAFDFSNWSADNYVLVPAMIYGGNRFRILPIGYPPYIYNEKDRPLDMPATTTNILHLNPDGSHAKIEMNTGNVATPMLSFFSPREKRGFILLAGQGTRFGNNGLFIEEDAARQQMTLVVAAPGVRSQRYTMCGRGGTWDKGADWKAGDELTLNFKVYNFACADLAAFYAQVFEVRKALSGKNVHTCTIPYSACANLVVNHFDKDKWFEDKTQPAYSNGPGSGSQYAYQIGWSGLPIYAYPASLRPTPERVRRVSLSLDTLTQAQGKSGLFYGMFMRGQPVGDNFGDCRKRPTIAMTRRTGEALYFGLKTLEALKAQGQTVKPEWETMFRTAANALVKLYADYGQFGQFADADTGTMEINGSTAGSVNITALVKAAAYFKDPRYLETAAKAGKLYAERDLARGYAGGGPGEILQAPDSESAYNLVEAYVMLYEATGKAEWLDRAKAAAHLFSTWMMSYDYQFPKGSDMDRAGIHAAGTIFASSQNNHSAPGLYISSGDFLLKLFRATGDLRIAEMYRDTAHNVVQYAGAPHNPLRTRSGATTERVQVSDWEGNNVGQHDGHDSNMAWETLVALSCLENPGLYLNTTTGDLLVLDHLEARANPIGGGQVITLQITNPTQYAASVSILAETAEQAKRPLPSTACLSWPRLTIEAGATHVVTIDRKSGKIQSAITLSSFDQPPAKP